MMVWYFQINVVILCSVNGEDWLIIFVSPQSLVDSDMESYTATVTTYHGQYNTKYIIMLIEQLTNILINIGWNLGSGSASRVNLGNSQIQFLLPLWLEKPAFAESRCIHSARRQNDQRGKIAVGHSTPTAYVPPLVILRCAAPQGVIICSYCDIGFVIALSWRVAAQPRVGGVRISCLSKPRLGSGLDRGKTLAVRPPWWPPYGQRGNDQMISDDIKCQRYGYLVAIVFWKLTGWTKWNFMLFPWFKTLTAEVASLASWRVAQGPKNTFACLCWASF